jgi:hypothetical protein
MDCTFAVFSGVHAVLILPPGFLTIAEAMLWNILPISS